jgi:VWFA-related protein
MMRRASVILGTIAFAALWLASPSTGKKGEDPEEGLEYKTSVTSVELAVGVWDKQGHFVPGLTKDDFEVREEGKLVPVETFQLISLAQGASANQPGVQHDPERRRFILFLDLLNTGTRGIQAIRPHLMQFANQVLGPDDSILIAALMPDRRLQLLQDFDSPRERLPRIFEAIQGNGALNDERDRQEKELAEIFSRQDIVVSNPQGQADAVGQRASALQRAANLVRSYAVEEHSRSVHTLQALGGFADWVDQRDQDQSLRVMLYVSEGFPGHPAQDAIELVNQQIERFNRFAESNAGSSLPQRLARVPFDLELEPLYKLTAARLSRSRIITYAVDPLNQSNPGSDGRGHMGGSTRQISAPTQFLRVRPALNLLSEPTGGQAFIDHTDLGAALQQVVQDTSMRYLLTYRAPKHEKKKKKVKVYKIDVKVKKPDVVVRSRNTYVD